jgi:hypothetical protein
LIALTVVSALPRDAALYPPGADEETITVYLGYNWQHADLILPTEEVAARAPLLAEAFAMMPSGEWMSVGWGDRDHYRERGGTFARRLDFWRSMLTLGNRSVVHFRPMFEDPSPETVGRAVLAIELSEEGFARAVARIEASLATVDGAPVPGGFGRRAESLFFESVEASGGPLICNHWIGAVLNEAGVPSTPVIDTATNGLAWDLRTRAGAAQMAGTPTSTFDPATETPPAHSGRWTPMDEATELASGDVWLDAYDVTFEHAGDYETESGSLAPAGDTFAEVLDVPANSLVNLRPVTRAPRQDGICEDAEVEHLLFGFRTEGGRRYEIAIAAYSGGPEESPCAVLQFLQP